MLNIKWNDVMKRTSTKKLKKIQTDDSFHQAIRKVLLISQIFGIMPLHGILNNNPQKIHFKWLSLRIIPFLIIAITGSIDSILSTVRTVSVGVSMATIGPIIFYASNLYGILFFFRLGIDCPSVIQIWQQKEEIFLHPPYFLNKRKLINKFRIIWCIMLIVAISEHGLYQITFVSRAIQDINKCNLSTSVFQIVYEIHNSHINAVIPYNPITMIIITYVRLSCTYIWTYIDVFIMLVSTCIATRFNQIKDRLLTSKEFVKSDSFWMEIRCQYHELMKFVQFLDKKLGPLILLSCSTNMYFICNQIFQSFTSMPPRPIDAAYFWYSMLFIIFRTLMMLFCASTIPTASKSFMIIIQGQPSHIFTKEVERFLDMVTDSTVALSGLGLFRLSRRLILAMAGTVATYELVLLNEFQESSSEPALKNIC